MNTQQKQNLLCKNYIPFRIFQKHDKFLCVLLGVISSSINIFISEEWYSNLLVWSFLWQHHKKKKNHAIGNFLEAILMGALI